MIARVLTMHFQPDKVAELAQLCREEYVAVFERMAGFRGGDWIADATTGKVMQVTFWDDEASIQGMIDSQERQTLERRVMPLAAAEPGLVIENFTVLARTPGKA